MLPGSTLKLKVFTRESLAATGHISLYCRVFRGGSAASYAGSRVAVLLDLEADLQLGSSCSFPSQLEVHTDFVFSGPGLEPGFSRPMAAHLHFEHRDARPSNVPGKLSKHNPNMHA